MNTTYTTTVKSEAEAIVKALDAAIYYLGHGEYARPEYKVRKVRGADEFEIYAKYYYYSGTFNCKENGPICAERAHYAMA